MTGRLGLLRESPTRLAYSPSALRTGAGQARNESRFSQVRGESQRLVLKLTNDRRGKSTLRVLH
jgi:hypothetical protein